MTETTKPTLERFEMDPFDDDYALDCIALCLLDAVTASVKELARQRGVSGHVETSQDDDGDDEHFVQVGVGSRVLRLDFDRDEWAEVYGTTRALVAYHMLQELVEDDQQDADFGTATAA